MNMRRGAFISASSIHPCFMAGSPASHVPKQEPLTRDRRARYIVAMVMVCSGDYPNLERARVMAEGVFGGELVSPLAPSRGSAEATFRVGPTAGGTRTRSSSGWRSSTGPDGSRRATPSSSTA
jgi:hypothetical protein